MPIEGVTPPGDPRRIPLVDPAPPTGDATRKQKDPPEAGKKKRVTPRGDGTFEILPDEGDPVIVTLEELARRYRETFGEELPPGSIIDQRM